jgi:D-arabinose 1-dehydrogenase-like Zn-dependent alcohol dehydrogenase
VSESCGLWPTSPARTRSNFELAPTIPVETAVEMHPLVDANLALGRLRSGMIRGSAVLLVDGS